MVSGNRPTEEDVGIEVIAAHIVPDLIGEHEGDTLLHEDVTQAQFALSADTIVQEVIDGLIGHRGERRAVGEACIFGNPCPQLLIHQLAASLYTSPVGSVSASLVTLLEQGLGLDEAALGIGANVGRRAHAGVERTRLSRLEHAATGAAVQDAGISEVTLAVAGALDIDGITLTGIILSVNIPAVGARVEHGAQGTALAIDFTGHVNAKRTTPVAHPLHVGAAVGILAGAVSPGDDVVGTGILNAVTSKVGQVVIEHLGHHVTGIHTANREQG